MLGRLRWLSVSAFVAVAVTARAASFEVSPVHIDLSPAKVTAVLTLTNNGDAPTVVQCQVVSWTQRDERDVYVPTRDLIATPPIFTVAPGKKQLVRIGLRRPPQGTHETAYRVYLQEVPGPPKPGFQGLRIALRMGIPVFVAPGSPIRPVMQWTARLDATGDLSVALHNAGSAHVQVLGFTVSRPGIAEPLVRDKMLAYVLPGQSMHWSLKPQRAPRAGETVRLKAQTNSGEIDQDLVLKGP